MQGARACGKRNRGKRAPGDAPAKRLVCVDGRAAAVISAWGRATAVNGRELKGIREGAAQSMQHLSMAVAPQQPSSCRSPGGDSPQPSYLCREGEGPTLPAPPPSSRSSESKSSVAACRAGGAYKRLGAGASGPAAPPSQEALPPPDTTSPRGRGNEEPGSAILGTEGPPPRRPR